MGYISQFFDDPLGMLLIFALALPGRLMAITAHEYAHARVADKCGDHTARYMGRLTLNPLKHLDLLGTLMMLLVGFGWAKPVPVNPRNYKNYRRDDLKVSLAGIAMNLVLFVTSAIAMYVIVGMALSEAAKAGRYSAFYLEKYLGETYFVVKDVDLAVYSLKDILRYAPYISDILIAPVFGTAAGYIYDVLMYFCLTNLVLAIFNLIPVPPLDGYHVLNDTILKRNALFVSARTARISMGVLYALMLTGVTGSVIEFVSNGALSILGGAADGVFRMLGIY